MKLAEPIKPFKNNVQTFPFQVYSIVQISRQTNKADLQSSAFSLHILCKCLSSNMFFKKIFFKSQMPKSSTSRPPAYISWVIFSVRSFDWTMWSKWYLERKTNAVNVGKVKEDLLWHPSVLISSVVLNTFVLDHCLTIQCIDFCEMISLRSVHLCVRWARWNQSTYK